MLTSNLALNITEIVILQLGAIAFGIAIHFFFVSRKALKQTVTPKKPSFVSAVSSTANPEEKNKKGAGLQQRIQNSISKKKAPVQETENDFLSKYKNIFKEEPVEPSFPAQKKLNPLFEDKNEYLEDEEEERLRQEEMKELEMLLKKRGHEPKAPVQQAASTTQNMMSKIEEVYKEFDLLKKKMSSLEKEALQSTDLNLELEDARQSYQHLEEELAKKEDKIEQLTEENQHIREQLQAAETKLREFNQQRHQLMKKTQVLEDMNNDLQHMSGNNKKMQTELRRIGELESMLNLMQEESSYLARRSSK